MPERFNISYIDDQGSKKVPVMVHRAVLGSLERFMGALIENYGGAFPLWLSPVQVKILSISDRHNEYAGKVAKELREAGIRVELDIKRETIGLKIRNAQKEKVPYMLILGDKEVKSKKVAVRERSKGDLGTKKTADFIKDCRAEIDKRR